MSQPAPASRLWVPLGVAALLIILVLQLAFSVRRNSITWDEDDHIYAGYMMWKHADFGLNPEHPPLVKLLAAIPLLNMDLKMPELQNRNFKHEAFLGGKDFIFKNDADAMLFRARMAAAVFTVVLALLVFLAAKEMFGTGAAFIALGLLVFDPNLLAHGAVVGTDAGLSCLMFASVYAFYRYVKVPSAWRLVLVGIATGLALTVKHTGILVFPILFLLAVVEIVRGTTPLKPKEGLNGAPAEVVRGTTPLKPKEGLNGAPAEVVRGTTPLKPKEGLNGAPKPDPTLAKGWRTWATNGRTWATIGQMAIALVIIAAIALTILWGSYGFRYKARGEGHEVNPPFAEFVQGLSRPREVKLLQTVAHYRLLPESYIYGLADVRIMSDFYASYLLGKVYPHGVWFYFPLAFAIKSSLSFLILLAITVFAIAIGKLRAWREILFLTIPPIFHLIIAMSSGMNIGVRHILPMYLFFAVLIGGATWKLIGGNRKWAYVVVALLVFQAISTSRTYPAYIAYANELWGGPANVHNLLSDSNSDWGQQLKDVKMYLDKRGVKDCYFIYFAEGVVPYESYGVPCKPLPTADSLWVKEPANAPPVIDGTVLISAGDLSGFEFGAGRLNPYEQFKTLKPTAVIDYGVFVYDGRFEIPYAASIGHSQRADWLMEAHQPAEALVEAQQAVALAPEWVKPNAMMGDILTELNRPEEARPYYQKALTLAKTVEPEFQVGWVEGLEKKVASSAAADLPMAK